MEVFPFIFFCILASTYSVTRANFLSCNETGDEYYLECNPENPSVLVTVHQDFLPKKHHVDGNTEKRLVPISLKFYPIDYKGSCPIRNITVTVSNDSFSDFPELTSLRVECVQFQGFPTPFRNHGKLESLTFVENKLTEFPREFCANICSLKNITVAFQKITTLSKASFSSITPNLEGLYLRDNYLIIIEPETFSRFKYLKTLQLWNNLLRVLRPDMFYGLSRLEILDLEGNSIYTIHPDTFANMNALRILDLNSNELEDLPTRVFSNLSNLERLDIHKNYIDYYPSSFLKGLDKLEVCLWGYNQVHRIETNRNKPVLKQVVEWFSDNIGIPSLLI